MNIFPCKLYDLLEKADALGYSHIISWQQGGKSFRVWNSNLLEASILPTHFKQSKYKSFLRQLNTYHFRRITSGVNRGGYAHPSFVRGRRDQCKAIKRVTDQTDSVSSVPMKPGMHVIASPCHFGPKLFFDVDISLPHGIPMEFTPQQHSIRSKTEPLVTSKDLDIFVELFEPSSAKALENHDSSFDMPPTIPGMELEPIPVLPANSRQHDVIRHVAPFPLVSEHTSALVSTSNSDLQRSESTFPRKVYRMLQDVEKTKMDHIISWINDGTAFRVHNTESFVNNILPLYFDQTLYESFRRQLNMYGFTRVTRGPLKGTCYHKNFCRHSPCLLDLISRRKRLGDKRRQSSAQQKLAKPARC